MKGLPWLLAFALSSSNWKVEASDAVSCMDLKSRDIPEYGHDDDFISHWMNTHCCKVDYSAAGYELKEQYCVHDYGCCGEIDNQYCCTEDPDPDKGESSSRSFSKTEIGIIAGCTVFGALVLLGLFLLFWWIYKKVKSGLRDHHDHKKILRDVYSAETMADLFQAPRPLVSAPGTTVHPVTNVNEPYYLQTRPAYVMPPPSCPQPAHTTHTHSSGGGDDDFGNEENWDRWDGYPASPDDVTVTAGDNPPGGVGGARGRNHPGYQAEGGGEGESRPYYYEQYDNYTQPPPAYDEVAKETV